MEEKNAGAAPSNFIHGIIERDIEQGLYGSKVHTRFPPEPNGYLHIGHAKSICLNFTTALKYKGLCNLRFDDTNPEKENAEYTESIMEDVKWLGFAWGERLFYTSDYFENKERARVCGRSERGRNKEKPRHAHRSRERQPFQKQKRR